MTDFPSNKVDKHVGKKTNSQLQSTAIEDNQSATHLQNTSDLYFVFSHPLRRQIIELFYYEYQLQSKNLQLELKQIPGTLYHHLKKLIDLGLIEKTQNRDFILTLKGLEAARALLPQRNIEISLSESHYEVVKTKERQFHPRQQSVNNSNITLAEERKVITPDTQIDITKITTDEHENTLEQTTTVNQEETFSIQNTKLVIDNNLPRQLSFEQTLVHNIYLHAKLTLLFTYLSLVILILINQEFHLGLIGCMSFHTDDSLILIGSIVSSYIALIGLVWAVSSVFSAQEPWNLGYFGLVGSLLIPYSLTLLFFRAMDIISLNNMPLTNLMFELLGATGQFYCIVGIYLIYRHINLMDARSAFISAITVNYSFLIVYSIFF